MWMCLEEGEVVRGRREGFWAVVEVEVGLCDGREEWRPMARVGMMTCSFLFV